MRTQTFSCSPSQLDEAEDCCCGDVIGFLATAVPGLPMTKSVMGTFWFIWGLLSSPLMPKCFIFVRTPLSSLDKAHDNADKVASCALYVFFFLVDETGIAGERDDDTAHSDTLGPFNGLK